MIGLNILHGINQVLGVRQEGPEHIGKLPYTDRGASLPEYVVLIGCLSVTLLIAIPGLGERPSKNLAEAANELQQASSVQSDATPGDYPNLSLLQNDAGDSPATCVSDGSPPQKDNTQPEATEVGWNYAPCILD